MKNELEELNNRRLVIQERMHVTMQQYAVNNEEARSLHRTLKKQLKRGFGQYLDMAPATTVQLLSNADALQLWDFEQYNQVAFTHQEFPQRMDAQELSSEANFSQAMQLKHRDHAHDLAYHYLIRCGKEMTGCMELLDVQRTGIHSAQLAWHIRPGFATKEHNAQAVQDMLNHAFYTHGLQQVRSMVQTDNACDIYALTHNGFILSDEPDADALQQQFVIDAPMSPESELMA